MNRVSVIEAIFKSEPTKVHYFITKDFCPNELIDAFGVDYSNEEPLEYKELHTTLTTRIFVNYIKLSVEGADEATVNEVVERETKRLARCIRFGEG